MLGALMRPKRSKKEKHCITIPTIPAFFKGCTMSPKLSVVRHDPSYLDYGLVESKIKACETTGSPRAKAFSRYVLETFFDISESDFALHVLDGGRDRGADIIFIDHAKSVINICNCKCVSKFENAKKNFPGNEVDKIISLIEDIVYRNEDALHAANALLSAKISEIWQLFAEGSYYQINVHLFSNQLCLAPHERDRLISSLSKHSTKLFEHGLYELAHGVVRSATPRFKKKLNAEKDSSYDVNETPSGIQTRVSLTEFFNFIKQDGQFDERLVAPNVRYFLGLDNTVNMSIKDTLLNPESASFWALNNGVTIICDKVVCPGKGNHPITLVNPKIVNGGQTAFVIFDVGLNTLKKLPTGTVSVKIIETSDETLITKIAIASNTQSRISSRDLKAVDQFQTKLALAISNMGFFYRRKRGETHPTLRSTIDMARAGQVLLSYVCGEPTKSKTSSNEIFDNLYKEAFDPNTTTAELIIAGYLVHQEIERQRAPAIEKQRLRVRSSFDEHWIIEGHFHVLFVVGELMRRKGLKLDDSTTAISLIPEAMQIVGDFAERNAHRSAYRLFRITTSKSELLGFVGSAPESTSGAIQLNLEL